MTMLDDDRLASLLGRAAADLRGAATGADDILARARGPARTPAADDGAGDGR